MPSTTDRLPLLARLGRWCHERRWAVVGLWLAALIGLGVVMGATGTGYSTEFSLPDVESAHGFDVIDAEFGGTGGGATGTIVFSYEGDGGVNAPEVREPMAALFAEVADVPHVDRVLSPYDEGGQRQIAADGDVAYAEVEMPRDTNLEEAADVREEIFDLEPDVEGLRVELGGQMFAEFEPPDSELIGLSFAIVSQRIEQPDHAAWIATKRSEHGSVYQTRLALGANFGLSLARTKPRSQCRRHYRIAAHGSRRHRRA
jgi:RND superfamily putative drug exporter